jgi:hypothetical protein
MLDPNTIERIKTGLAVIFFIVIVYPIRFIVFPLVKIVYENLYLFACGFLLWVILIITGDVNGLGNALNAKLISSPDSVSWIVKPIFTVFNLNITPIDLLLGSIIILLIYKMFTEAYKLWTVFKTWFGHIMLLSLWSWYVMIGNKENSMMCLRSNDEKKSLLVFYGIIFVLIIGLIGMYFIQTSMSNLILTTLNATFVQNETISFAANETLMPVNVSISDITMYI